MANDKEQRKKNAYALFMDGRYTQKEIAAMIGTSENTISSWAAKNNWKASRTAMAMRDDNINKNGKLSLANLTEMLLDTQNKRNAEVEKEEELRDKELIEELNKEIFRISDAMSKIKKSYEGIDKRNKITYDTYINVMDAIFDALKTYDPQLHLKTVDFQMMHMQEMATKIG